jgi:hypothetical protein
VFLRELTQGDELLLGQTVLLRNKEDNFILEKRLAEQTSAGRRIEAQHKIKIPRQERVKRAGRDFGHNPQVNVFMLALEGADNRRQPVIARPAVRTKPDGFRVMRTAAQAFFCVVHYLEGPGRRFQ